MQDCLDNTCRGAGDVLSDWKWNGHPVRRDLADDHPTFQSLFDVLIDTRLKSRFLSFIHPSSYRRAYTHIFCSQLHNHYADSIEARSLISQILLRARRASTSTLHVTGLNHPNSAGSVGGAPSRSGSK